jgi:uncharacterized lipoprotein YbaY
MKKVYFAMIGVAAVLMACAQPQKTEEVTEEVVEVVEDTVSTETNIFGEAITLEGAITVDELLAMMAESDSVNAKVIATATDVCAKKGCWMKVALPDSAEMRITFKDYGFFVPKDIAGKQVVFEGYAKLDITSVDDLRHFAEDAGKTPEEIAAITEDERAVVFEATGVMIN